MEQRVESSQAVSITLRPRRVATVLGVTAVALICLSLLGQFSTHVLGHGSLYGFVDKFNVDLENNVPTWFGSMCLALAAAILAVIATFKSREGDRWSMHWKVLCGLFAFMSLDEMASLHERLVRILRPLTSDWGSAFYFAWVVAGIGFVIVAGLFFLRFLLNLRPPTRRLVVIAGLLYVGGALGMEMVGGAYVKDLDAVDLTYVAIVTIEETLELAGTILFIYALLDYARAGGIAARISPGEA